MNKNLTDLALLILRLGSGGLMLTHGIPKINMLFADPIHPEIEEGEKRS